MRAWLFKPAFAFQNSRLKFWPRLAAAALAWATLGPHLAWALDAQAWSAPKPAAHALTPFSIPASLASITQASPQAAPRVIHIQDLHCQYETQAGIAKLLEHLHHAYGVSLILTEGASRPVNLTKLSTFPSAAARQQAAEFLMRQGKMSGAEAYAALSGAGIRLQGIEDADLYTMERASLKRFLTSEVQGLAADFRDQLNLCQAQIFSPAWLALDHLALGFERGELPPRQYGRYLQSLAQRSALVLSPVPEWAAYLAGEGPDGDADQVAQTLKAWDHELREQACRTDFEKQCYAWLQLYGHWEACLNLNATPQDLAALRENPDPREPLAFSARLAPYGFTQEPEALQALEAALQAAQRFYALADQRSQVFARNTCRALAENRAQTAVLITGGYHTQALLREFQKRSLAYCSVKMKHQSGGSENPYFSLLADARLPLERMLAPEPGQLALPPFCAETANPGQILDEQTLSGDTARAYDFLEELLQTLGAAERFTPRAFSPDTFKARYADLIKAYPAHSPRIHLDLDNLQVYGQTLCIPLDRRTPAALAITPLGRRPFVLIYPKTENKRLPSPASLFTIQGHSLAFYPGPMRAGVEAKLRNAAWKSQWQNTAARIRSAARAMLKNPFALLAGRIRGRQTGPAPAPNPPQGKVTVLPVFTELIGDLKLAAGLLPILEHFSARPPSWAWTAASFGLVMAVIAFSSVLSNWLMARSQHRAFSLKETAGVFRKEWQDYLRGWSKFFKEFKDNFRFQPKASWAALGLLILARGFDYGTQFFKLNHLNLILAYSGFGLAIMAASLAALRSSRKTAWFSDMIQQSLRIVGAVVVVQLLKLPFAFALLAVGAGQLFTERVNDAILKWLKKVVGVLSCVDLFTSLRAWITGTGKTPASRAASPGVWKRLWHLANPQNPASQLFYLFMVSNVLFMNFYFSLPLQVLLALQLAAGAVLAGLWGMIFKNVKVSQKVKMISLTGILPAALSALLQLGLLLVTFGSAVFAQYLPAGYPDLIAHLALPSTLGELAGFIAMMYSLLGFASIMKDQIKFDQAALPEARRLSAIQALLKDRLEQARPRLEERLSPGEISELHKAIALRLFSNAGQPEWLKEFLGSGLHVYKENVYLRRRLFNLLNDETLADLILAGVLKRKLPAEEAGSIARAVTGRDPRQDETLMRKILQGGTAQEMESALALINQREGKLDAAARAAFQRQALEKRYRVVFSVPAGTYPREFSGSWPLLNQKMQLMLHYRIPVHPYFLRLSPDRLGRLGRYLARRSDHPDASACRKILETGELEAYAPWPMRWAFAATLRLPIFVRQPVEALWLKNFPAPYLHDLLRGNFSRLATLLRDRRTPQARAFQAWADSPRDPVRIKNWLHVCLEALDRESMDLDGRGRSLLTLSDLSRAMASWQSKPCGRLETVPGNPQTLELPSVILEPGSSGLRGALADLAQTLPVRWDLKLPLRLPRPRFRLLAIRA